MLETVRTSQNRTPTCDLLVRPNFMYQTNTRKSLVLAFVIVFWYRHFGPCRWLGAGMGTLARKARDRANVGLGRGDTPSKRRTVRKLDGGTYYDSRTRDTDITETSEYLESRVLRFICFSGDRRLPLFCDRIVISN